MDLLLIIALLILLSTVALYVRFTRFALQTREKEMQMLSYRKHQEQTVEHAYDKEDAALELAIAKTRERMVKSFEKKLDEEAVRLQKELDTRLAEYVHTACTSLDSSIAAAVAKSVESLRVYEKEKQEDINGRVEAVIARASKKSIARGISLDIHEKLVERAIAEAIHEIS